MVTAGGTAARARAGRAVLAALLGVV